MSTKLNSVTITPYSMEKDTILQKGLDANTDLLWWDMWERPEEFLDMASDATVYQIKSNQIARLDQISYDFYRTPRLWWLIAAVNDMLDPFGDMIEMVGATIGAAALAGPAKILVPKKSRVDAYLRRQTRAQS